MYSLEVIKSLNNRPVKLNTPFNRDSSFVQSRAGFVIHSGVHRSTAFIGKDDCPDSWHAFNYWSKQGQSAVNAYIEAVIDGASLEGAELNAFTACRPDWTVTRVKGTGKNKGAGQLTATRPSGSLVERVSAHTYTHLHFRTAP